MAGSISGLSKAVDLSSSRLEYYEEMSSMIKHLIQDNVLAVFCFKCKYAGIFCFYPFAFVPVCYWDFTLRRTLKIILTLGLKEVSYPWSKTRCVDVGDCI